VQFIRLERYFIGVKARNEMRQGDVGLNESARPMLRLFEDARMGYRGGQAASGGSKPLGSRGAMMADHVGEAYV